MGKRLHVVNFTFTILDEGRKAYSAEGNYCLATGELRYDETSTFQHSERSGKPLHKWPELQD